MELLHPPHGLGSRCLLSLGLKLPLGEDRGLVPPAAFQTALKHSENKCRESLEMPDPVSSLPF